MERDFYDDSIEAAIQYHEKKNAGMDQVPVFVINTISGKSFVGTPTVLTASLLTLKPWAKDEMKNEWKLAANTPPIYIRRELIEAATLFYVGA